MCVEGGSCYIAGCSSVCLYNISPPFSFLMGLDSASALPIIFFSFPKSKLLHMVFSSSAHYCLRDLGEV